jgi:hypothetical protein
VKFDAPALNTVMDEDTLFGSPITLAELRLLGEFVRWQDLDARVADLVAAKRLPNGYPLVPSRLPTDGKVDLCVGSRWRQVAFVRMEGSRGQGNRRIVYSDDGAEQSTRYDWYGVAPAGHFTEWNGARPAMLAGAELLDRFELAQDGHVIHSQELVKEDWPYLTFRVRSFHPKARWVELDDMWVGSYTVHAADPRVKVPGIVPREPWFNTTIAVSHRWLHPEHPDPDRIQHAELIALCERLGLHETQALLIDYCSLPQEPRGADEAAWFAEHLPGFQSQYKYVTLVLNTGAADYATRAWCMLELMLAAMSETPRPTLLNHDQLDEPLRGARDLAQRYVRESIWNQQALLKATRGGLTAATFANWSRDLTNVALYNAAIGGRRSILEKFENELALTNPDDRPIVVGLLKQLAFGESAE